MKGRRPSYIKHIAACAWRRHAPRSSARRESGEWRWRHELWHRAAAATACMVKSRALLFELTAGNAQQQHLGVRRRELSRAHADGRSWRGARSGALAGGEKRELRARNEEMPARR